jgi:ABC-type branched-subunit amino acid transport system substrate-binding protein
MVKRWIAGLAAAAALGMAGAGSALAQQPIKIAFLSSLSGPFTPWGILVRDGMKLAAAEINAAGGVNGRPIEIVERDDRNNANEDPVAARKAFIARQPMGRLARPEEMAPLIVYLASDESVFVTGQAYAAYGGITI